MNLELEKVIEEYLLNKFIIHGQSPLSATLSSSYWNEETFLVSIFWRWNGKNWNQSLESNLQQKKRQPH